MKPFAVAVLIVTAALEACTTTHSGGGSSAPRHSLTGTTWHLEEINGHDVISRSRASLTLSPEGRMGGNTNCNAMFGHVALDGHNVKFEMMGSTKMACVDPDVMTQEHRYLDALKQVVTWRVDGDNLILTDRARTDVLVFEAE